MVPLLVVPALGQLGPLIRAGDVRVEVGGVIRQRFDLQLLGLHHLAHHLRFDASQQLFRQGIHLLPEMFAGQVAGREAHQPRQVSLRGPAGKCALAPRCASPSDDPGQQRFAHGKAIPLLYPVAVVLQRPINVPGHVQLAGQCTQGGHRAGTDGSDLERGALTLDQTQHVLGSPQMNQYAQAWLAVLAKGLDDAVIASSVRLISLEGSHGLRIGKTNSTLSTIISDQEL
jgi:hypothetical protein